MTVHTQPGRDYSPKGRVNDMLILNRKPGESIIIDDKIEVTILEVQDGRVKLGIEAPKSISILRKEVYEEVVEANRKSLEVEIDVMDFLKKIK